MSSAQAIVRGRPIPRDNSQAIPRGTTEVFLDFEGAESGLGSDGGLGVVNYLIGNVVRRDGAATEFIPFFADSVAEEETNLQEFLYWCRSLENPIFYHWHHYEKTHLNKMVSYYDISPERAAPVLERLTDLHPIATKSYAFPTYGEGLKDMDTGISTDRIGQGLAVLHLLAIHEQGKVFAQTTLVVEEIAAQGLVLFEDLLEDLPHGVALSIGWEK